MHIIKGNDTDIVYYGDTFMMMIVNKVVCQILETLKKGHSPEEVANKINLPESDVISVIKSIEEKISNGVSLLPTQNLDTSKVVDRITLHISNDCNLRCKYCYASGGNYMQERTLMNEKTARDFVNFCILNFDQVKQIVFFGGEPMLNVKIMKVVCNLFKQNFVEGKILYIPKFGIITNGTIINSDIIEFFKENITDITVSIDGPKDVNDANRVYSNGNGSYKAIKRFITTVKEETTIPIIYEATYTKEHIEMEYRTKDISNFMLKEFEMKGIIVDDKNLNTDRLLDSWLNFDYNVAVDNNFENMPAGFWSILQVITSKQSQGICPVMNKIFSISSNGYIFPCHMLTGNTNENLGNVRTQNFFNQKSTYESKDFILDLKNNPKCNSCWCKKLCSGCAVQYFYNDQKKKFQKEPNKGVCEITKKCVEQIILIIATLRRNSLYWEKLIAKAKERVH